MKLNTALYKILVIVFTCVFTFLFFLKTNTSAADDPVTFDPTITAFIDIDKFSSVKVVPSSNEISVSSDVRVRILDRNSNPISKRRIELYTDTVIDGLTLVQPSKLTNADGYAYGKVSSLVPGVYTIRARDITFSKTINIIDSDDFYVFPISAPHIKSEPYYTPGLSNSIYWSHPHSDIYEFYIEISKNPNFNIVLGNSGWIKSTDFTFNNLTEGALYFYRVKSRNSLKGESGWSDTVFSVQDNTPPVITPVDNVKISDENKNIEIQFTVDVKDNLSLKDVILYCQKNDKSLVECGYIQDNGSQYSIHIPFEKINETKYITDNNYIFCIKASDSAGNISKNCDFKLIVTEGLDINDGIIGKLNDILEGFNDGLNSINSLIVGKYESASQFTLIVFSAVILIPLYILVIFSITQSVFLMGNYLEYMLRRLWGYFFPSKYKQKAGHVYDSLSEKPVKWAKVSIYNGKNDLVAKEITDRYGNFYVSLDSGKYRIVVNHANYLFPSFLSGESKEQHVNAYKGDYIFAGQKNPMNIEIPLDHKNIMDSDEKEAHVNYIILTLLRNLAIFASILGLMTVIYAFYRDGNPFSLVIMALYLPAIILFVYSLTWYRFKNKDSN